MSVELIKNCTDSLRVKFLSYLDKKAYTESEKRNETYSQQGK